MASPRFPVRMSLEPLRRHFAFILSSCPPLAIVKPLNHVKPRPRGIAVGTAITGRRPHRSVRAELPHTGLTVDHDD